jgi:hypothetical protein
MFNSNIASICSNLSFRTDLTLYWFTSHKCPSRDVSRRGQKFHSPEAGACVEMFRFIVSQTGRVKLIVLTYSPRSHSAMCWNLLLVRRSQVKIAQHRYRIQRVWVAFPFSLAVDKEQIPVRIYPRVPFRAKVYRNLIKGWSVYFFQRKENPLNLLPRSTQSRHTVINHQSLSSRVSSRLVALSHAKSISCRSVRPVWHQ